MIKKITAMLLTLLMCVFAASCSADNGDVPDGMKLSSLEDEPFKLYVPDGWTVNTVSGISCAYYSYMDKIMVTARYISHENASITLDEYVSELCLGYAESLELFNLISNEPSVLGGNDARELIYTGKYDQKDYTFRQRVTAHGGDFVLLTFYCPTEYYESNTTQFNSIIDVFTLCEKGNTTGDFVTDKHTPAGMKIASSDNIEYRLYVPESWICYSESGKSEAYYPESSKPNVTVTTYSPDDAMTAEQYFAECEKEYKETLSGYELISSEERTVAGRSAISYTYRVTQGQTSIKLMQTVFVYSELVYSITYTALEDRFDAHMKDVNMILDSFIFR